jgi:hypothetical protein
MAEATNHTGKVSLTGITGTTGIMKIKGIMETMEVISTGIKASEPMATIS